MRLFAYSWRDGEVPRAKVVPTHVQNNLAKNIERKRNILLLY